MLFTCLNALAAMWLFSTPMLWPDLPARGVLAAIFGIAALLLGVLGIVSRAARQGLVAIGIALGVINFFLPGGIGIMASFVTSALLVMAGGLSPVPHVVVEKAAVAPVAPETRPAPLPVRAAA